MKRKLDIFAILWIILSSGSLYFNISKMETSMIILLLIGLFMLIKYKKINYKNIIIFIVAIIILIINFIINRDNVLKINTLLIYAIRLISLTIIYSNIDDKSFKNYYVNIMMVIAIISLVCYLIIIISPNFKLPFEQIIINNEKTYIATFYFTKGLRSVFDRNAGPFWEPGLYQIFLNIAILFILSDKNKFIKNKKIKIILLSITVITTFSTTGYMCYAIVLLYYTFSLDRISKKNKVSIFILIFAFIIIETNYNVIGYKLIEQNGSYNTRANDLSSTMTMIKTRPILGYGANNVVSRFNLNYYYNVDSNSNGLMSFFLDFGIVVGFIYLIQIYINLVKLLKCNRIQRIFLIILFMLFLNSEPIIPLTLFIGFIFKFKDYNKSLA